MLTTGIRLVFFILSTSGYILFIHKKSKIQVEFIPIISIATITISLFFSGLLNILPLATLFLFSLGIFLLIKEIYVGYYNNTLYATVKGFITPGIVIFLIASVYFIFILKNQRLIHYDNFSHWGLIVKSLLKNDALPNFEDTIIGFNTYPPGSALYIYYFTKVVGTSEGVALIGQITVILSGLLSLFSFSSFLLLTFKENKSFYLQKMLLTFVTLLVSLYLLHGPSSIHNLLVDTLLNTTSLALFALIYYYLDSIDKVTIPVAIVISFLSLIKNSGVFFGILALFLYGYGLKKYQQDREMKFLRLDPVLFMPFISPVAIYYLWGQHVKMVFQTGRIGKHTMSLSFYMNMYSGKTSEEIKKVSVKFLNAIFNEYALQLLILLLLLISLIALQKILSNYLDKRLVRMSIVILSIFLVYSLGLWVMYLVSMPTSESLRLAGYQRYMATIIDYLIGISVVALLYSMNRATSKSLIVIANGLLISSFVYLVLWGSMQNLLTVFQRKEFPMAEDDVSIANIDVALTTLSSNPFESTSGSDDYYIYYPKEESKPIDYEQYFLKYRLYENTVKIERNIDNIEELWNSDYLSVTLVTEEIMNLFDKYSEDIPEIGTYRINKDEKMIGK